MHGGNLRLARATYNREIVVDLSANINPFGPPRGVTQALERGLADIIHYPDPECYEFIQLLAAQTQLEPDWICAGNGAGELIFSVMHALRPRRVLLPIPSFSEYERAARACGAKISTLPIGEKGWNGVDFSTWSKALAETDALFLCSPHNPTGSAISPEQFETLLAVARSHTCSIIFDESFYDFLPDDKRWSARQYLADHPQLVVLYSLTKFYAIPGLRLGVVFAHPQWIRAIKGVRDPWSVNVLAQKAGVAALEDQEFPALVRARITEAKAFFYQEFAKRSWTKLELLPSQVNFALLKLHGLSSTELTHRLALQGILVRDCRNFQGLAGEYIRVAIKDQVGMGLFLDGLEKVLSLGE